MKFLENQNYCKLLTCCRPLFGLVLYIYIYIYAFIFSLSATWEAPGGWHLKGGPGFLEEQPHGACDEAGDPRHGGGWSSGGCWAVNSGVADGLRGKIGEMEKKRRGNYGVRQGERVLESLRRRAWWRESDEQLKEKRNGKRAVGAGEGRWCLKEEILPKGFFRWVCRIFLSLISYPLLFIVCFCYLSIISLGVYGLSLAEYEFDFMLVPFWLFRDFFDFSHK